LSRNEKGQFAAGTPSERRRKWVGERLGKLVVLSVEYGVQIGKKRRTVLTCKCDCGNIVTKIADSISDREHASCGCDTDERRAQKNRKDLTGQRFGRLVVKEMLWVQPHTKCRCICDCGNETIVTNTQLTYGKTKSCGCLQREMATVANTKDYSGVRAESGVVFIKPYRHLQRAASGGGVWEWECECPLCGSHFNEIPAVILSGHRISCGCATPVTSHGEKYIAGLLDSLGVVYKHEYKIPDCKNIKTLRFDFAIFNNDGTLKHLIEYDGEQHFEPIKHFGGLTAYEQRKARDEIKNKYCKDNNIPMTRLPYTMSFEKIKDTIENIINP